MNEDTKKFQVNSWYPFNTNKIDRWAYWDGAFEKADCEKIIEYGLTQNLKPGTIDGHLANLNLAYRESNISWIMPQEMPEVFHKFEHIVRNLNEQCFGFDLSGFGEGLQFTEYKSPNGNYNWHADMVPQGVIRKLSISLQLSDPADYEGGELQLSHRQDSPEHTISLGKKQGMVFVFPSWEVHRVTPVTKGTRYSLVGWVTGPSFK